MRLVALVRPEHVRLFLSARGIGPVAATLAISLLLSMVALLGAITPNNDGMLYVEVAQAFQQDGLAGARRMFDWIFLPVLMGSVSSLTGLGVETSGYLLCTLFFAGTCALIVACTRDRFPEAAWAAGAVVLAMPALNKYRDYIIRESGAWFFLLLAFWLVLRWARNPRWTSVVLAQLSICAAALFRVEALVFLAAAPLWQICAGERSGRLAMTLLVPVVGVVAFAVLWAIDPGSMGGRLGHLFDSIDPLRKLELFQAAADRVAAAVLNDFSADESKSILFFGLLSILPVKFLANFGVFVVPIAYVFNRQRFGALLREWGPFSWAFLIYVLVLVAFLFEHLFLTARYVAPLNLFAVPLAALGLVGLYRAFPRLRVLMGAIIVIAMIANVVSTSPAKTRHVDAAHWLKAHSHDPRGIYFDDPEVAYLAGYSAVRAAAAALTREQIAEEVAAGRLQLVFLRASRNDSETEAWAARNGLKVVGRFGDGSRRMVLAMEPAASGAGQ